MLEGTTELDLLRILYMPYMHLLQHLIDMLVVTIFGFAVHEVRVH